jgi:hypothetical protein
MSNFQYPIKCPIFNVHKLNVILIIGHLDLHWKLDIRNWKLFLIYPYLTIKSTHFRLLIYGQYGNYELT